MINDYGIESLSDIKFAIKDLLCNTIKEMMEVEMDDHIGSSKMNILMIEITTEMGIKLKELEVNIVIQNLKYHKIEILLLIH